MVQEGATDPLIGQSIGSYVIQRRLGEGGMGAVYELLHPGIGKRLALKLLHAEYAARPQIVQRFFDEARAVNVIGHPNIVDIIDFANLPDGRAYITMEFLEGDSLASYIRKRGALPVNEVAEIAHAIASALAAAHTSGIVHRDLKPENIHLVPRPDNPRYVKVLDFGIAKLSSDLHADPSSATRSGVVMGTPTYMSPEQAMGRTREIDHRTDIYALGIIIYEMLTGEVPFQAESFGDLMLKHLQAQATPVRQLRPELGEGWNAVVDRALAKKREDRFQSMDDMVAAIDAAASGRVPAVAAPGDRTVAAQMGNVGSAPALPQGGGNGTVAYGQTPPPQQQGTLQAAAGATPSVVEVPRGGSKAALFGVAGVLAAIAAVVIFFVVRGGGSGKEAVAQVPPDAMVAATPVTPPDAAVAIATPPDAMVAIALPPDAAPPPKQNKPPHHDSKPKGKGKLKVLATPWATVIVDGKEKGTTPLTIELSAGRHKIELRNSEMGAPQRKRVTIKADKTQTISAHF